MTVDERLERLTERHEALTQTGEMMALENKEQDRRLNGITEDISKLTSRQAEIMEGLASLVHVAEIHEHRTERLEDAG